MRQLRLRTVLIGTGATLALVVGGTAAYAAIASPIDSSGVIHGCYKTTGTNGAHAVVLQNAGTACASGYTAIKWNQKGPAGPAGPVGPQGPQGPSGVVSMASFTPSGATNTGVNWAFTGSTVTEHFTDSNTAAEVTATVDEASADGNGVNGFLGICYEPAGGSTVFGVSEVEPEFQSSADSWFAQTVSGIVGNLAPGNYAIGMCQREDTANLLNGLATGTIIMGETAAGVTAASPVHAASPAQLRPAQHG